jgi:hypothetical protein
MYEGSAFVAGPGFLAVWAGDVEQTVSRIVHNLRICMIIGLPYEKY